MGVLGYCLSVDIHLSTVLPLGPLNYGTDCGHPGAPGTAMGGPYHFYGDSTMEIYTCPGIGLPPLGREAAGQAFQHSLHLCSQKAIHWDDKGGKGKEFLETGIQIITFPPDPQQGGFSMAFLKLSMQHPYSWITCRGCSLPPSASWLGSYIRPYVQSLLPPMLCC